MAAPVASGRKGNRPFQGGSESFGQTSTFSHTVRLAVTDTRDSRPTSHDDEGIFRPLTLRLFGNQGSISSVPRQQLVVGPLFHDRPLVQHQDQIGVADVGGDSQKETCSAG
jgi:hypothetical protein